MRHAFTLLGLMTAIVTIGAFIAFERAEAPVVPKGNLPQPMTLSLTSPAFSDGGRIPQVHTCDGNNTNPEMHIANVPADTKSLVLVMDDSDIPESVKETYGITKWDHWVVYNIPADTVRLGEGEAIGTAGVNTSGKSAYAGPCPPDREHRYSFRLYALSGTLNFIKTPTLDEVEIAARGMELGKAVLTGTYERAK